MNPYLPQQYTITKISNLTEDTKLFSLNPGLNFTPGQFVLAGLLGFGEAPISLASAPSKRSLELAIRSVGKLTKKLHQLKVGEIITLRGPYGNGFPIKKLIGKNILIISGGCGLAGMRSLIEYLLANSRKFGEIQIMYGAKTTKQFLFRSDIDRWKKDLEILLTVDQPEKSWRGNSGLITNLITSTTVDRQNTVTVLCGPPMMFNAVAKKLLKFGFEKSDIYISLERNMRCGVGVCQHCTCGTKYVCKDGPVFSLEEIEKMGDF